MWLTIPLHILAAAIWVGGMFFAYLALRPAAADLEPAQRLALWSRTLKRFFVWVWVAVVVLPVTGYWMVFAVFGGFRNAGIHVQIMHIIGIIMILLFLHVYFAPYRRLNRALAASDFATAGEQLNEIRARIAINLILGLAVIVIAGGGAYWR
jgi:uncharacterized membrane protein